jgi:mono/diheme cytochrome c family protein
MTRLEAVVVASALALAGCSKQDGGKDRDRAAPAAPSEPTPASTPGSAGSVGVPPGGTPAPTSTASAAMIERGKYLTNVTGCVGCHTGIGPTGPALDKLWAGGLSATERGFGTWVSPNITPDLETGIGKWTDEQIMAAIREGRRLDGSQIAPIMPWPLYNRLTDDDARAMVAFLRTVPPIVNKVARGDIKMPPVPATKPANLPIGDTPVARGAYYATLMHCVMCHTAMTASGPDLANAFAGGLEMEMPPAMGSGKLVTANITSDPDSGIGKWSEADIIKAIRSAQRPDGSLILGPMMLYFPMWSQITDDDAAAIATFIKALPPNHRKVAKSTFTPAGPPR